MRFDFNAEDAEDAEEGLMLGESVVPVRAVVSNRRGRRGHRGNLIAGE